MDSGDLERLIGDRLRRLPTPHAPATLGPRVMRSVEEWAARPWYARAWITWPLGWRIVSLAASVATLVAFLTYLPPASALPSASVADVVQGVALRTVPGAERAEVVATAILVVWRALVAPVVPYALAVVMLMFLACGLAGTALSYLVFGKAANR